MNDKSIGQRILVRRKELLIPQRQLAHLTKVSSATISLWESDKTTPNGVNLHNLATALQCSAEWILYGNTEHNPSPASPIANELFLSDDELEFLSLYRGLPASEKVVEIQSLREKHDYFNQIFEEMKVVRRQQAKKINT